MSIRRAFGCRAGTWSEGDDCHAGSFLLPWVFWNAPAIWAPMQTRPVAMRSPLRWNGYALTRWATFQGLLAVLPGRREGRGFSGWRLTLACLPPHSVYCDANGSRTAPLLDGNGPGRQQSRNGESENRNRSALRYRTRPGQTHPPRLFHPHRRRIRKVSIAAQHRHRIVTIRRAGG